VKRRISMGLPNPKITNETFTPGENLEAAPVLLGVDPSTKQVFVLMKSTNTAVNLIWEGTAEKVDELIADLVWCKQELLKLTDTPS
jgi:hypothetical protein